MYRSVASFGCNEVYLLDGASSIECQADEQWSNDVPTCRQVGKIFPLVGWVGDCLVRYHDMFMAEVFGWSFYWLIMTERLSKGQ